MAYRAIGDTEITGNVREIKSIGSDVKSQVIRAPGSDRYTVFHDGREARGWDLTLQAINDEDSLDDLLALFNSAAEDTPFYPYSNSRFGRIALASAWEDDIKLKLNEFWRGKAKILLACACLFGPARMWRPALGALVAATPSGPIAAPLDQLIVTGHYAGGNHLKTLGIKIWDNAGAVLQDSLTISDQLLTDEVLTLDYRGRIKQTYLDPFTDGTKFGQDATNDGGSVGSGVLTLGNETSAHWKLSGPWPLSKELLVSADIVISAGVPVLQYSFDGATWQTAYSGLELTSQRSWTIPNTKGRGDVYIRFKSQSADRATLSTALGTNKNLTYTARKTGTDGNSVSVTYSNPGGTNPLSLSVAGDKLTVSLATSSGAITTTASQLIDAIWADPIVMALFYNVQYKAGEDGSGTLAAMSETYLSGATVDASMTIDNLQFDQERKIPESELPMLHPGAASKVEIDEAASGSSGSASIECTYRNRYWI